MLRVKCKRKNLLTQRLAVGLLNVDLHPTAYRVDSYNTENVIDELGLCLCFVL